MSIWFSSTCNSDACRAVKGCMPKGALRPKQTQYTTHGIIASERQPCSSTWHWEHLLCLCKRVLSPFVPVLLEKWMNVYLSLQITIPTRKRLFKFFYKYFSRWKILASRWIMKDRELLCIIRAVQRLFFTKCSSYANITKPWLHWSPKTSIAFKDCNGWENREFHLLYLYAEFMLIT